MGKEVNVRELVTRLREGLYAASRAADATDNIILWKRLREDVSAADAYLASAEAQPSAAGGDFDPYPDATCYRTAAVPVSAGGELEQEIATALALCRQQRGVITSPRAVRLLTGLLGILATERARAEAAEAREAGATKELDARAAQLRLSRANTDAWERRANDFEDQLRVAQAAIRRAFEWVRDNAEHTPDCGAREWPATERGCFCLLENVQTELERHLVTADDEDAEYTSRLVTAEAALNREHQRFVEANAELQDLALHCQRYEAQLTHLHALATGADVPEEQDTTEAARAVRGLREQLAAVLVLFDAACRFGGTGVSDRYSEAVALVTRPAPEQTEGK